MTQELGGKSPNIVLDDEDFAKSVTAGVVGDDDEQRAEL